MPVAEREGKCDAVSYDVCAVDLSLETMAYLKGYPISSTPLSRMIPLQSVDDSPYAVTSLHLRLMADRRRYWNREAKTDDLKGT